MASGTGVFSKAGVDQWSMPVADIIIDVGPTSNKKVDDRNYRHLNVSSDGTAEWQEQRDRHWRWRQAYQMGDNCLPSNTLTSVW
jgi:hypothetical protein